MKKLEELLSVIGGIALAVVFLVVFGQVLGRYVVHKPIPWSMDVVRIAFVLSIFVGMAVGVFRKSHLNIDVLVHALPDRLKPCVDIFTNLVVIFFLSFVCWYSIPYIRSNGDQLTPYLMIPMSYVYAIIPVSMGFMLLYLIVDTVRQIRRRNS